MQAVRCRLPDRNHKPGRSVQFRGCYTHNYREFMGGFGDWVETVAESDSARDYRQKVAGAETVSMWQSLSFGANYKAAYCLSVCPAGEDVIGPYLGDRKQYMEDTLKPLREKPETIYVARGTDAEDFVARSLPHKRVKIVRSGLPRQSSIRGFSRCHSSFSADAPRGWPRPISSRHRPRAG